MKEIKTAKYKEIIKKAYQINEDISEVDNEEYLNDGNRTALGDALLQFDFEMWSDADEDAIVVDDDSSFIHGVGYHLLGGAEIYPDEYMGAINELNKLIEENNRIDSAVSLTTEQVQEIPGIRQRLYQYMQKESS